MSPRHSEDAGSPDLLHLAEGPAWRKSRSLRLYHIFPAPGGTVSEMSLVVVVYPHVLRRSLAGHVDRGMVKKTGIGVTGT